MLPPTIRALAKALRLRLRFWDEHNPKDLPLDFNGQLYLELNPDVAEKNINPYLHYLRQGRAENRPFKPEHLPSPGANEPTPQTLPDDFLPEEYLQLNPDLQDPSIDLEEHFLRYGIFEFRRYKADKPPAIPKLAKYINLPEDFDPEVYLTLNPDLLSAPINAYDHYAEFGHSEGRLTRAPKLLSSFGAEYDPQKPTVLMISHEASRTGAPILAWNICQHLNTTHNTVVLLLGGGELVTNFEFDAYATYVIPTARYDKAMAKLVVTELCKRHHFEFAILNSIESGIFCKPLTIAEIPSLLLIHEFAAYTMPRERFLEAYMWASVSVFSNNLIKSNAIDSFPQNLIEETYVLPQGKCKLPPNIESINKTGNSHTDSLTTIKQIKKSGRKLVIGIGTICLRKGIDLFVEVATRMAFMTDRNSIHFVWVGAQPPHNNEYSAFLNDQIERAKMKDCISIIPESSNLDEIYESASLLLLTSRLDPLPNVAIDAICCGLPIVCFDRASGIADILNQCNLGEPCVAEYINTADMALKATKIISTTNQNHLKDALKAIGSDKFSMPHYYNRLFELRHTAIDQIKSRTKEVELIMNSDHFNFNYHTETTQQQQQQHPGLKLEECWEYVLRTRIGALRRKPQIGFNPHIYRERLGLPMTIDPLVHYIQNSDMKKYQPPHIITPTSEPLTTNTPTILRVALHIHAYYPELLADILDRLIANKTALDIYITVDTEEKKNVVEQLLQSYSFKHVTITQQINQGRDVYPFLLLSKELINQYDVIGHVHTKASPHVSHMVPRWRNMVLGNLLGSANEEKMLDRIVSFMGTHPKIEIVFPDDPFIVGWASNYESAKELITEGELKSLPLFFDFPIGTMFWARSAYLEYFTKLDIPNRFPLEEPLPIDGTVLHAWERLLGARVGADSSTYALTSVPGLSR